jgi:hypothetical protein
MQRELAQNLAVIVAVPRSANLCNESRVYYFHWRYQICQLHHLIDCQISCIALSNVSSLGYLSDEGGKLLKGISFFGKTAASCALLCWRFCRLPSHTMQPIAMIASTPTIAIYHASYLMNVKAAGVLSRLTMMPAF